MEDAVKFNGGQRHRMRRNAIASECCGSIASVMLNDSAVIILFVSMLEVGSAFSMLTTSLRSIASCLLVLPCAYFSGRFGYRRSIQYSSVLSCGFFLLLAAAPWFGTAAGAVAMTAAALFCAFYPFYLASWFPTIDVFLRKEERGGFFGINRFFWMGASFGFIFLCGLWLGKHPALWQLQAAIALAGLLLLGRSYFIGKLAEPSEAIQTGTDDDGVPPPPDFRSALHTSLTNSPLCGFSIYLFSLNLASCSTLPLGFMYLKNDLGARGNLLIIVSAVTLLGTLFGYLVSGRLLRRFGPKMILLTLHVLFAVVNFGLFCCSGELALAVPAVTALLTVYGFLSAASGVVCSSEMMALARPGNKAMAMALCGSFQSGGAGLSRLFSSLLLGGGLLASDWAIGWRHFTSCQSLFLISAVVVIIVALMLVLVPAIMTDHDYYYEAH